MENLLAIINDPANSKEFIRYSYSLAEEFNFNVHLLYIQNPTIYSMSSGSIRAGSQPVGTEIEIDKKNALSLIQEKVRKVKKELPNEKSVNLSAETGSKKLVIKEYMKEKRAEMIILEGKKEGGLWTTQTDNMSLIQNIKYPGWLIPYRSDYVPYKRILYATDYKETDLTVLKNLIRLTRVFSPEITMAHVADSDELEDEAKTSGFMEMIKKKVDYDNIIIKKLINKGNRSIGDMLNEYAVENNINLLVLLKENKSFLEKLFIPGVAKKILKKSDIPVLVYPQ